MKNKPSPWLLILAPLILAACSRQEAAPEPVRAVRTITITAESAGGAHEYAAEIRARTESRLGFRVSGKMVRRSAEIGHRVKAGEVLAQLDPEDLKLGQDAARAGSRAAQVNVDLAEADFRRFKELRDQGFISAAELERRESTLRAAQATLEQAKAQAGVQGNQTAYSSLVATAPGVITAVEAEVGAVLSAGTPVVRVAHDGPRDAVFAVPEDVVAGVRMLLDKPGAVRVRVWGSTKEVPATVREVAAAADAATRTFQVKADLPAADLQLGQTASVIIDLPRVDGVAKLPLSAVTEQGGKTSVWLVDKATMTVRAQPVEVLGAEGNTVLVSSGLNPGQIVVTAGVHVLTAGQKVKFYIASDMPASAASR